MQTDTYQIHYPKNLDIEKFLEANPPSFKYKIDSFRYIIGLPYEIATHNKDLTERSSYMPINAQLLQRKVHDYKKYLCYLIEKKIFKTDNQFIKGKKSKGYCYGDEYQVEFKSDVIQTRIFVRKLKKETPYQKAMQKGYWHLKKWFNNKLEMDFDSAFDFLTAKLKEDMLNDVENYKWKFQVSLLLLEKFKNRQFSFLVDDGVGRCHTLFTNCKRELRNFVKYDGLSLVAVDIVNSQPCFSGLLLNEQFYTYEGALTNDNKEIFNIGKLSVNKRDRITNKSFKRINKNKKIIKEIISYIMLVKSAETNTGKGFEPYIENVQNGRLYEYMEEVFYTSLGMRMESRQKLKEMMFKVLYTDNRYLAQEDARGKRLFKQLFPEVYHVFSLVKRPDKTLLPRMLQSIEAKFMLDYVSRRIATERPDLPIFTIHDSIVCPVGNEAYVAQVIKEEMVLRIGMSPEVKYEYWNPENIKSKNIEHQPLKRAA